MLHQLSTQCFTQGIANFNTFSAIITKNTDFNQFMRCQCGIGFFNDRVGQTLLANHNDRVEVVCLAFKAKISLVLNLLSLILSKYPIKKNNGYIVRDLEHLRGK